MSEATAPLRNDPLRNVNAGNIPKNQNRVSFPLRIWRFLIAIKDGLVLLFMLLLFGLFIAVLTQDKGGASSRVDEGALLLKLDGFITEQASEPDSLQSLVRSGSGQSAKQYQTRDLVRALRTAARDDRVTAVVLDLSGFLGGGQVAISDVGKALDAVRAMDKPVLAYASLYSDDSYQLASHASEIWVDPLGGAIIGGPGTSRLYYKKLIDRLGANIHVYRAGTFKSAVEPFIRSNQSPESKEATRAFVDVLWDEWQTEVKKNRPDIQLDTYTKGPANFMTSVDKGLPEAAQNAGFIDKIGTRFEFDQRVGEIAGLADEDKPWQYRNIALNHWLTMNPPSTEGSAIAVIPIVGEIVDGKSSGGKAGGETVADQILSAASDEDIKALVVRVDSPGGSAAASEKIRQAILYAKNEKKLPIIVSMANVAASGGYWVATPADQIFAEPDTITGSIGVFAMIPSFEGILDKVGVQADGVTTTPMATQPNYTQGFSKEFDALMQASVLNTYHVFTTMVATSRKQSLEKIQKIAEGRVWAGGTARQLGLVDQFGGIEEATAVAAKQAGIEGKFYPRYYQKTLSPLEQFLSNILTQQSVAPSSLWSQQIYWEQQRLIQDVAMMMNSSGSVQAHCLECSGAQATMPTRATQAERHWLQMLLD